MGDRVESTGHHTAVFPLPTTTFAKSAFSKGNLGPSQGFPDIQSLQIPTKVGMGTLIFFTKNHYKLHGEVTAKICMYSSLDTESLGNLDK